MLHSVKNYVQGVVVNIILVQYSDKLYCILLYCVVLNCIVLLICCYVDIIKYNAMHKFVRVLENPCKHGPEHCSQGFVGCHTMLNATCFTEVLPQVML